MKIIYLHGFASSPASKKARYFAERFAAAGVATATPDLAPDGFAALTLSGQLGVVEREARGEPCVLMGSSMGGYLAALYAARHTEVERVILLAPAFDFAARWRQRLGEVAMEEWRRTGYLNVFHYGAGEEARLGYQLFEDALGYEAYPVVTQPSLVCHGRGDDVVPLALAEEFADRTPQARLVALDSDHELISALPEIEREVFAFLGLPLVGGAVENAAG